MIRKVITSFKNESLYVNSFYNMAGSIVTAGLGFLFWFFSARLYTPEQVGLASSLISAMGIISYLSLLGFNTTFVRFLPTSKRRNEEISTGLVLVLVGSVVASLLYVVLIPMIAPSLQFLHSSWLLSLGFVVLCAIAALNFLTDSIFIAFRAAKYNLIVYTVMGILKLGLPVLFVGLGAFGLFGAAGAVGVVGLLLSLFYIIKLFSYQPRFKVDRQAIKELFSFSASNYVANLLNILPPLMTPLIVMNQLGAVANGYYYLTFMVANLLNTVAFAMAQSLFAEGSYAERELKGLLKRAVFVMSLVMIPGVLVVYFGAPFVLGIYGPAYAAAATPLLQIFALSAPLVAAYTILNVLQRIYKQVFGLIIVNAVYVVSVTWLTIIWSGNGLVWVGYAWLISQALAATTGLAMLGIARLRGARANA